MLARAYLPGAGGMILLDEPTSYSDIKYKLDFLSILQEMRKKKELTVVMSLHEFETGGKAQSTEFTSVSMEAVWNVLELRRRFLKRDISKNYFTIETGSFDERSQKVWNGTRSKENLRCL